MAEEVSFPSHCGCFCVCFQEPCFSKKSFTVPEKLLYFVMQYELNTLYLFADVKWYREDIFSCHVTITSVSDFFFRFVFFFVLFCFVFVFSVSIPLLNEYLFSLEISCYQCSSNISFDDCIEKQTTVNCPIPVHQCAKMEHKKITRGTPSTYYKGCTTSDKCKQTNERTVDCCSDDLCNTGNKHFLFLILR